MTIKKLIKKIDPTHIVKALNSRMRLLRCVSLLSRRAVAPRRFSPPTRFAASSLFSTDSSPTAARVNNLLYNLPTEMEADEKHILSVFVENTSGTLSKISGLLAARGFNIDTLTVASSNIAGVSRMTVVLSCSHSQMLQARKQVEDLVDVWAVVDASANAIKREMVLAKISTFPPSSSLSPFMEGNEEQPTGDRAPTYDDLMEAAAHRESVTALAVMFGAEVVDVGTNQIILELVSWQRRVDAFLRAIEPFGIIEVARSGAIAMERSEVAETDTSRDSKERSALQEQDISALPPS